jgi:prevent-host-death family protein
MTLQVNIAEAKARLSELVARAEAGEEVVLARSGKPILRLQTLSRPARKKKHRFIGALAHLGPLTDEEANLFLEPDPEFEAAARSEDEDHLYK